MNISCWLHFLEYPIKKKNWLDDGYHLENNILPNMAADTRLLVQPFNYLLRCTSSLRVPSLSPAAPDDRPPDFTERKKRKWKYIINFCWIDEGFWKEKNWSIQLRTCPEPTCNINEPLISYELYTLSDINYSPRPGDDAFQILHGARFVPGCSRRRIGLWSVIVVTTKCWT